ncbi:MAG TPA: neprosin family prolyl endopeptidase [Rhizomicrobium sp.]|jgi:hypothetical protein
MRKWMFAAGGLLSLLALSAEPAAAQSIQAASYAQFQQSVTGARAQDYIGHPGFKVQSAAAFEEMRGHLQQMYSGVVTRGGYTQDNATFDCVTVASQPGASGLRQIAAPPSLSPASAEGRSHLEPETLTGNAQHCSSGTIPLRRVTIDQLARFRTLREFFHKSPFDAHVLRPDIAQPQHKYAFTYQYVTNYGGSSAISVYDPVIKTANDEVFSLTQHWYVGTVSNDDAATQTAETGWQVFPEFYNTTKPVLFIYYTADDYNNTGCYNLTCKAFVQISNTWALGGAMPHVSTATSVVQVQFGYYFHGGNWWLSIGNDWVGYYPATLYKGGQLSKAANLIEYGGETVGSTIWPPMGSGKFANAAGASYQHKIQYRNGAGKLVKPSLTVDLPSPACYTATVPAFSAKWLTYFNYGGPGGTKC